MIHNYYYTFNILSMIIESDTSTVIHKLTYIDSNSLMLNLAEKSNDFPNGQSKDEAQDGRFMKTVKISSFRCCCLFKLLFQDWVQTYRLTSDK